MFLEEVKFSFCMNESFVAKWQQIWPLFGLGRVKTDQFVRATGVICMIIIRCWIVRGPGLLDLLMGLSGRIRPSFEIKSEPGMPAQFRLDGQVSVGIRSLSSRHHSVVSNPTEWLFNGEVRLNGTHSCSGHCSTKNRTGQLLIKVEE